MVEESLVARPGEPRVSIGNPSLDAMLEGGLVGRRPYLIVGPSGTGKTTLAIQFLCDGVRRGERVLLVTLEEPPNEARVNHRGLEPDLGRVDVFDAIPDIMRYERTPFKDIASVRSAVPFDHVPFRIRRSPELASVEVTITALEQMLRTEVIRKGYTRLVIDSLTALQYFCMKGFDPVAGAQSFLRFLSDMRVTTLLTVEAPLEDVETPERMLARGEIRLFRWELEGQTVRAVGVEKFRGSSHDVRLHPYRIGPQGLDINLEVTISRDTRQIIEPILRHPVAPATPIAPLLSPVTPLIEEVRDLVLLGADVAPARAEIEAALSATTEGRLDEAQAHISRASSLVLGFVDTLRQSPGRGVPDDAAAALQRLYARADTARTGGPPTSLPPKPALEVQLGALLSLLPAPTPAPPTELPPRPPTEEIAPAAPTPAAALPETPAPIPEPTISEPATESPPAPPPAAPEPPPGEVPEPVVEPAEFLTPPAPVVPPPAPAEAPEPVVEVAQPLPAPPKKSLPPPPKPHPSVAGPRGTKPAAPAVPVRTVKPLEQPPLPSTTTPDWLTHPPHPSGTQEHPTGSVSSAAPTPPHHAGTQTAPPSLTPTKKRRKPAPAAAGKRGAGTRGSGAHSPAAHAEASPAVAAATPPELPHMGPIPPPEGSEVPPKTRRRAPRKRKAPPVVRVDVEPIPPGVFGNPEDGPSDPDPSARPEG
ncbi:MAG TPA: ATPase domain-containing protein [Thermoplasmata archaeon]|nr:ATPase domain-containing protein [Thermoplasmata archaeon]